MPKTTILLDSINGARVTLYRYESGFQEMSATIPEVLQGAGPILVAAAQKAATSKRWAVCPPNVTWAGRLMVLGRGRAASALMEHAQAEIRKRAHLYARPAPIDVQALARANGWTRGGH